MVDVTVMGAGISGLSVAYACAVRGARVQVIETRRIGAGSSGGVVGALAPHTPERWDATKEFQLQSLLQAEAFWQGVDALSGRPSGYRRLGRLQPINDARGLALAQERAVAARTLWQGRAVWQVVARQDFGAWAPRSATGYLVHDTLSARLHPRQALASLAGALRALGGAIILGGGTPAGRIVWATGHEGLAALSRDFGCEAGNGVKGQAALLRHDAADLVQLFADGVHVVPHADGTVAVGSTSERYFTGPDTTDAQLEDVLARARAAFPVLAGAEVLERWAGVRPRARTRAPMLGQWPGRPDHFIVNGGFKIGFAMAPKLAGLMADLLLEGRDEIPEGFRASAILQGP